MPVYVDEAKHKYGRMVMCHMVADTELELHAMADLIGIDRKHFQDTRYPHYDICKAKREQAIYAGAFQVTSKTLVRIARGDYSITKPVFAGRRIDGQKEAPNASGARNLQHDSKPKEEDEGLSPDSSKSLDTIQFLFTMLSKIPECFTMSDNPPPQNARFTVGISGDRLVARDKLTGQIIKIERATLMEVTDGD